nr:MAG TPA: hypothetical protein [Caudoviricetes sp.]
MFNNVHELIFTGFFDHFRGVAFDLARAQIVV